MWNLEPEIGQSLEAAIPGIFDGQRPNGQFGTDPWICHDQHHIFALAAAWALEEGRYFHDDRLLDAIIAGGDALMEQYDDVGMWTFRKKDGSTWGQVYMPWTYSRWIRCYGLVRDSFSTEARDRWDGALTLGFEGIASTCLERVHNIPAHHAMALYRAGEVLGRMEWCNTASEFMASVVKEQSQYGWWTEHVGPVVVYNFVYVDALGVYYVMSGDENVLPALERAAQFHSDWVYPNGSIVETIDERNPYRPAVSLGNPGFSLSDVGRGFLKQQHRRHIESADGDDPVFDTDYAANMILYCQSGESTPPAGGQDRSVCPMGDKALTVRRRPWFVGLSAFTAEVPENRWIQDRQNFVSVFHDETGLIVGGGNTKLQPLWSSFSVGDTSLLKHAPGDEEPQFRPDGDLLHVPDDVAITSDASEPKISLRYGDVWCYVHLSLDSDDRLELRYGCDETLGQNVEAHLVLMPNVDEPLVLPTGDSVDLFGDRVEIDCGDGGDIEHLGWRVSLPSGARIIWPALPHNPYRKAGDAEITEGRVVVAMSLSDSEPEREVAIKLR